MSWSAIACYEDVNTFKPSENMLFPVRADHPVVAELKERFANVHETISHPWRHARFVVVWQVLGASYGSASVWD